MKNFLFSIIVLAFYATSVESQSGFYEQCGGKEWKGLVKCFFVYLNIKYDLPVIIIKKIKDLQAVSLDLNAFTANHITRNVYQLHLMKMKSLYIRNVVVKNGQVWLILIDAFLF